MSWIGLNIFPTPNDGLSINPADAAAVPRASSGMQRHAQSAAAECTDRAIHVIHKSRSHAAAPVLFLRICLGEWPRYVGHVAETVAAQDFGTAGGSLHWDNAPRGIASNTLLLHYLPVQKQRQRRK